jgi:O-acetyl-ADP-ribose deacetylase (regulator of RNase III)
MINFTKGNLLEAPVEALVNTVNTVGIMGKGIALMFREAFPENFQRYAEACKHGDVQTGCMFVTERRSVLGPRWIVNFPTKKDWRTKTKPEWIADGLQDLRRFIIENGVRSIALPPLGCGNGGLSWSSVRPMIENVLNDLADVDVLVFEPSNEYHNVAKREGVERLTPSRALIVELVRRYSVLGLECSILEIQKLVWLLQRCIQAMRLNDPLDLDFEAGRYGPYAQKLQYQLRDLDGSYLHCDRRLADARPSDVIWFDDDRRELVGTYLKGAEAKAYEPALEATSEIIDGFQSPLGMELLATVDWLLSREHVSPHVNSIRSALSNWSGGREAGQRKLRLFDDRMLNLALERLQGMPATT